MSHHIVKMRPAWVRLTAGLALIAVLIVCVWGAYDYGRQQGFQDEVVKQQTIKQLERKRQEQEKAITRLHENKAILERSSKVEREAHYQLEMTVAELQNKILELEEELAFYRGIVSPKNAKSGLRIEEFEIVPGSELRKYHYKLVLTQVLNNNDFVSGSVELQIDGLFKGKPRTLARGEFESESEKQSKFRFRYFQNLEGDIVLPDGFRPVRMNVKVLPKGRKYKRLEQVYDWPQAENVENVG